jgi:hypothetical protein
VTDKHDQGKGAGGRAGGLTGIDLLFASMPCLAAQNDGPLAAGFWVCFRQKAQLALE